MAASSPRQWRPCSSKHSQRQTASSAHPPLVRGDVYREEQCDVVTSAVERAERLPRSIGEKLLLDTLGYGVGRLTSLADLRVPVMAVQTTYNNEKRERRPMSKGQTTPYLDMLRACIPSVRIEIIEDTGHFPQIDEKTNALLDSFLATQSLSGQS